MSVYTYLQIHKHEILGFLEGHSVPSMSLCREKKASVAADLTMSVQIHEHQKETLIRMAIVTHSGFLFFCLVTTSTAKDTISGLRTSLLPFPSPPPAILVGSSDKVLTFYSDMVRGNDMIKLILFPQSLPGNV